MHELIKKFTVTVIVMSLGSLVYLLLAQRPPRQQLSDEQLDICTEVLARHGRGQTVNTRAAWDKIKDKVGPLTNGDLFMAVSGSFVRVKISDKVFVDKTYDVMNPIVKAKGEEEELTLQQKK